LHSNFDIKKYFAVSTPNQYVIQGQSAVAPQPNVQYMQQPGFQNQAYYSNAAAAHQMVSKLESYSRLEYLNQGSSTWCPRAQGRPQEARWSPAGLF